MLKVQLKKSERRTHLRQDGSLAIFTRDGMANAGFIMSQQINKLESI